MIKIVKVDDFDEKKKHHDELMETNEDYRRATENLSFRKGRKLQLSIEVTDDFFSHSIFELLNGHMPGAELLGFRVNEVILHPNTQVAQQLKEMLLKLANDLDNPQVNNSL